MNAKDLSTIHILKDMIEAGIDSLKVEGRTKSVYYLSVVTRAYHLALKAIENGRSAEDIYGEVNAIANRGYISGFLERNPQKDGQNYLQSHSGNQTRQFAGIVDSWDDEKKLAVIKVRNRFMENDEMELMTPDETIPFRAEKMQTFKGEKISTAHGGGQDIMMFLPKEPGRYALIRKII